MEEIYCFGGNPLDRVSERRRDTVWIQSLLDDPGRVGRLGAPLPGMQGLALPALRSGDDHAGGARRLWPVGPRPPPPRRAVLLPGGLYGAGRDTGRFGAP